MNSARVRLAVADLTATLTTDFDISVLLDAVAQHAQEGFEASSAAVILLDYQHRAGDPASTIVAESQRGGVDAADLTFQRRGPGLASAREGAVVMIADLADTGDTRWPVYRRYAAAAGMRGMRAFPVTAVGVRWGSVVVHTDDPWGGLRPNDFGQVLANVTAIALSTRSTGRTAADTGRTVDEVVTGIATIGLATGVVAQALGLEVPEARRRLARLARAHGVTVAAYARVVVSAQGSRPDDVAATGVFNAPAVVQPPRHIDS